MLSSGMHKTGIETLVAYNFWANDRILNACERIPTDAFTRPVSPDPGWGSLHGILVHALDTEYGWRSVLQDLPATQVLDADDFADVAALRAHWVQEQAAWADYVVGLSDEDLNTAVGDEKQARVPWQTIVRVVNHGTQHRREAAAILTGYGQSPGELDFDLFLDERGSGSES